MSFLALKGPIINTFEKRKSVFLEQPRTIHHPSLRTPLWGSPALCLQLDEKHKALASRRKRCFVVPSACLKGNVRWSQSPVSVAFLTSPMAYSQNQCAQQRRKGSWQATNTLLVKDILRNMGHLKILTQGVPKQNRGAFPVGWQSKY